MTARIIRILAFTGMVLSSPGCLSWQQPDNHNSPPYCYADRSTEHCYDTMEQCQWQRDLVYQSVPEVELHARVMTECASGRTRVNVVNQ